MIFPDGALWKEQRRFMMRALRELGLGKKSMEDYIIDELKFFAKSLKTNGNKVKKKSYELTVAF